MVRNGSDGEHQPDEVDEQQGERQPDRGDGSPHEGDAGLDRDLAQRTARVAQRQRPEQQLVDGEERGEVEHEHGQRPRERARPAVETKRR